MSAGKTFVRRRGQTAIPNRTIYDKYEVLAGEDAQPKALSIQALGLLLLMLSRPSGKASMGYRAFEGRGMGRVALLRALRELDQTGHRHQFKRRSDSGSIVTDTVISEEPCTLAEAEAELAQRLAKSPVAPNTDARSKTEPKQPATVRRFTDARSGGALSVPETKGSLSSYLTKEPGEDQKADSTDLPAPSAEQHRDDATRPAPAPDVDGPGRAQIRALLAEKRRLRSQNMKGGRSAPADDNEVGHE